MSKRLVLTDPDRSSGYVRKALKGDVLYGFYRYKQLTITFAKKSGTPTNVTDLLARQMVADGIISDVQRQSCEERIKAQFTTVDHIGEFDDYSMEALYDLCHNLRKETLGGDALAQAWDAAAHRGCDFDLTGCIDQRCKKDALLQNCSAVIFALCQPELFSLLQADLAAAQGKQIYILTNQEPGGQLPTAQWFRQHLNQQMQFLTVDNLGVAYDAALQERIADACLLVYGEDGLLRCRGLQLESVVHAIPAGYYPQALTNQLGLKRPCVVYVPAHWDMTRWVGLRERTRLSFWHLAQLWKRHGDTIYSLTVPQLYRQYPTFFVNIYENGEAPSPCPFPLSLEGTDDVFTQFDSSLEQAIGQYLDSFENIRYCAAYFDENLQQQPICYDAAQKQPGILVHAVKVKKAAASCVISCEKGKSLRQMFTHGQTGIVSNFLFFMTSKLATLYNDLRQDRPMEQANVATGHLDYMLSYREGQRIETFPLFRKTCIGMKENGEFLFFNFRLGGGQITVNDQIFRWEKDAVDSGANVPIRVHTPYASLPDGDADRQTYRKSVGHDRVNLVILQDRIHCIRQGDVILPSVGVVISMTQKAAQPLLDKLPTLEDGYYDVSSLTLEVRLNPPEQIDPNEWSQLRWAYGGGLSLILDGVGLCDGDHMDRWFEADGWQSPLSRQTQESTLHTLVKHPRTAIGTTKDGQLVLLVFSGRTWRSTGADYQEMIAIARSLFGDIQYLMNMDGGGSAMLGMVTDSSYMELSCPSTSTGSCVGMVRPINTMLFIPVE